VRRIGVGAWSAQLIGAWRPTRRDAAGSRLDPQAAEEIGPAPRRESTEIEVRDEILAEDALWSKAA